MSDRTLLLSFGEHELYSIWWQPWTPRAWWFRLYRFGANGWHFYLPAIRITRAKR
ncbi:MAG: hypothetical protein AB7F22_25490 [Reyranella sp.]|uniref:hypothetical protein n=1 Tax=Reyranella sp. TaxID=1929291 RepID=UPI003D1529CE